MAATATPPYVDDAPKEPAPLGPLYKNYSGILQVSPQNPNAFGIPASQLANVKPPGPTTAQQSIINGGQLNYPVTDIPAVPATLSYQAAVGKALQPLINSIGGTTNLSNLNQALAGLPQAAAANTAMPGIGGQIAQSLQNQISDYKTGLSDMMQSVATQTPLQDILKGMGELLSYPTATSLTGTAGAPGGVQGNATLQEVYAELNNLRNGLNLTNGLGTSATAGYGANPLQTATGS